HERGRAATLTRRHTRSGTCTTLRCPFLVSQARDGIRDKLVTGVQTCALPIWTWGSGSARSVRRRGAASGRGSRAREIGRASCRERVEISVVAVSLKKKRK